MNQPASSELKFQYAHQLAMEIRRREDKISQLQGREYFWLILTLLPVCATVLFSSLWQNGLAALGFFILAGLGYLKFAKYQKRVKHESINSWILKHHLEGKLEAGLCTHAREAFCDCYAEYHLYLYQVYGLSL
ncbi:MAG: hypothetical protein LBT32_06885 [Peptococcaceae bacterium]|jgi:hypothetical protein|nr:hypothetical protein [Peptococcaceae bacterium]